MIPVRVYFFGPLSSTSDQLSIAGAIRNFVKVSDYGNDGDVL